MAISLKHNFQSAVADGGDTSLVQPSNWNAEHNLTLATSRLIGRTSAGAGSAEEISVGTGLNLSSGSLAVSSTTPQVNAVNTFTASQVIEVTDNSNPALRITQLGTADALRVEDETSPDATPFVITAAGHAIAGYGSTLTIETVAPQFQSHTATLDEGGFGGVDWGNTATGQVNWFGKSRGGSYGSQAIVQSGDTIGDFRFYGSDGVGFIPAAKIEVDVDGTPGVNDMPGRISFFTTADGAATSTERFRIGNAGQWGIGGATYGTSGQAFISGGASAAPSWGTLGFAGGGTGQTTASAAGAAIDGYLNIVSAAGTTTLTNTTARNILVTGTSTQTIVLPDVTTLALGWSFTITNSSTGNVTLQSSGGNSFPATINVGMIYRVMCIAVTGTTTASWSGNFIGGSSRTGAVNLVYSSSPSLAAPTISAPNIAYSTQTITAGTNAQGQGTISQPTELAFVTTTANNPSGVTLQTPAAGRRVTVFNLGTNPINVYPASGHTINALGANASVQIPVGYALLLEAQSATQWRTQNLGTSGQALVSGGSSTAPSWSTLGVAGGGTGVTSATAYAVLTGGTTSTGAFQTVSGLGTSGQALISSGAGALPAWGSPDALSTASGSAPSYSARAWANFDGTASPITIGSSGNVTSITDHGTGDYTVNITTALPNDNYSFVGSANNVGVVGENSNNVSRTTTALRMRIVGSGGTTNRDCSEVNVAFFD